MPQVFSPSDGESCYSQSDLSTSSSYNTSEAARLERHSPRSGPPSALSPREVSLIKSSFSSLRSVCYVSTGLATLFTSSSSTLDVTTVSRSHVVPVLLLNLGGSRARESRGVELILADRRTGLAIMRDRLDTLSSYRSEGSLHRWHHSTDHSLVLCLAWLSPHPAAQFCHKVQQLMDRPDNVGLSGPDKTRPGRRSKVKQKLKNKKPDKKDISSPCGFQHFVSLSVEEWTEMTTLQ